MQELERTIGCTGSPADSHELHWINLNTERTRRCPECGSGKLRPDIPAMKPEQISSVVYTLDYHGDGAHAH